MGNEQYRDHETLRLVKRIWISILIKENKTFNKKEKNELYDNSKKTRIKIVVSDTYETREIIVYKRLSRRSILQEMNTIKQILL